MRVQRGNRPTPPGGDGHGAPLNAHLPGATHMLRRPCTMACANDAGLGLS